MRFMLSFLLIITLLAAVQMDMAHALGRPDQPSSMGAQQTDHHAVDQDSSCCDTTGTHSQSCLGDVLTLATAGASMTEGRESRCPLPRPRAPASIDPDGLLDPPRA